MELDLADVRPSLLSWVTVGVMAVTFIVFMKYLTTRFNMGPLAHFFAAA